MAVDAARDGLHDRIYLAGHAGLVGSAILDPLVRGMIRGLVGGISTGPTATGGTSGGRGTFPLAPRVVDSRAWSKPNPLGPSGR